jgi:hypothetical protein
MNKNLRKKNQTSSIVTFTITMIRFLSENIKFLMFVFSTNFILKTLSSRFFQKSNILIRFVHEISCDVFIDSVVFKLDKEKSLREKFENIVFFITMTTKKIHIYDETEKLTTKANVCWRDDFETVLQKEKIVKNLHDKHQKKKTIIIAKYRASIKEWILIRRTWEYVLILNLFLTKEKSIIWSNDMTEKNLINYNAVLNNLVNEILMTTILNEIVIKKKLEADIFSTDSLKQIVKSTTLKITFENTQIKTFRKFKKQTTKRRKITENQFLHSDLQICIISNFFSVNIISKDDLM